MKLCLIDAFRQDDPALVNSHWVAERTASALRERHGAEIESLSGEEVFPASVMAVLGRTVDGYAYFGHGREHVLYRDKDSAGEPVALLDVEGARRIGPRWFHAFACWSGVTLGPEAAKSGAAAYLGYRVPVVVEWDIEDIPAELGRLLQELVTVATLALAAGQRSRSAIRREARAISDRVLEWMDVHWEECASMPWIQNAGIQKLANLLHVDLMLEGSSVVP